MCPNEPKDAIVSTPSWEILLNGPDRDRALGAIDDIAQALISPPAAWIPAFDAEPFRIARGITLGSGGPALAMFYLYHGRSLDAESAFAEQIERYLEYTAAGMEFAHLDMGFMYGLCGVLWGLDHIATAMGEQLEGLDEAMDEANEFLLERTFEKEGFDMWFGLAGHGIYALPRAAEPSARRLLDSVLERLLAAFDPDPAVAPWTIRPQSLRRPDRAGIPYPHTQLGVAHGVAGVIAFLAEAHRRGLGDGRLPAVCDRVWRWLDAQRSEDDLGPFWPNFSAPGQTPKRGMEMWCNGMMGIATVLLAAARKIDHGEMRAWSLDRAREMVVMAQRPEQPQEVSMCHGTAGVAHMFNRIFQQSGEEIFAETARFYLHMTLDMQKPGYGVGGFNAWGKNMSGDYADLFDPGLMIGSSGTGLILLAAVSHQVPHWDQALLLS